MKDNKINWVITKWCKSITDSGKDEYVNKDVDKKHMVHRFRLLDDDGIVYGYGVSDSKSLAPLRNYKASLGCVTIEYKNKSTGKYEPLWEDEPKPLVELQRMMGNILFK